MQKIYEDSKLSSDIYVKETSILQLKNEECGPSMNLLKIFDAFEPNYMDFLKDFENNKWLDSYLDKVLSVMAETDQLVRKYNFTSCQIAAVFEIFYSCFRHLAIFPKIEQNKFLEYFRQSLLLYTVNDPPECLRIFYAVQGFDVAKIFHEKVVTYFEEIKSNLFGRVTFD